MGPLVGVVILFVIAALLYFQSQKEDFRNPLPTPVAGRPYVAPTVINEEEFPADLNRAPTTIPTSSQIIPQSTQRPTTIPGAQTAPREAMAQRKDLYDLDNKISTWLAAAALYEAEHPGGLTAQQLERRIILQGRLANVRDQLVNDMIVDTYKQVAAEIRELRHENTGWGAPAPALDAVDNFAKTLATDAFLTEVQYREFRRLFDVIVNEYKNFTQPNPLERVRTQQLQIFQQELKRAEREFTPLPIRAGAARLFLQQALKPDQPLPTLFSMEPNPATLPSLATDPTDVIRQLKDIKWRLTVSYNPAETELKRSIAALLNRLEASDLRPDEVTAARSAVAGIYEFMDPVPLNSVAGPTPVLAYDPNDLRKRANTLCQQIREAFSPEDAAALGCPSTTITTEADAETTINVVCDRLRYSVPSVSPAQFNCPTTNV